MRVHKGVRWGHGVELAAGTSRFMQQQQQRHRSEAVEGRFSIRSAVYSLSMMRTWQQQPRGEEGGKARRGPQWRLEAAEQEGKRRRERHLQWPWSPVYWYRRL